GDVLFHAIAARDQAHLVIIADRAKCQQGGDLGSNVALLLVARTEQLATAAIDEDKHRQFPLLDEALDEGVPHAGGNVPIKRTNVVPGLVFAHLLESDARSLEDALVVPTQQVLDGAPGPY